MTLFVGLGVLPTPAFSADEQGPPKKPPTSMGDPARKRGLEIGFDQGVKAGKLDKAQSKKPDPKTHEAFNNPDKFYRYEYGSRAGFTSSFRSGFLGGYQQGIGQKVKGVTISKDPSHVGPHPSGVTPPGGTKTKPKAASPASDAL